MSETEDKPKKQGWLARLTGGLKKSSAKLTDGITAIFTKRKLDDEALEELEELLITADLGPLTAARITAEFGKSRFGKEVTDQEVREALAAQIAAILQPVAVPLKIGETSGRPHVILMVGVNGAGKTTTIGKLSNQFRAEGRSVMLAACDTFRAAAVEQLKVWGDRAGVPVMSAPEGADTAGLAYDAVEKAIADGTDVVLIDTAGRLQNKANLMEELAKIRRVLGKLMDDAPQTTLLVLDATTGQNAYNQAEIFTDIAGVTGLVVTKLDGSARGGVLVGLADRFGLPVHLIGVGEGINDMRPFAADDFARGLMGIDKSIETA